MDISIAPNLLTLSRIALVVPIALLLAYEQPLMALFLAILGFLTDFFDGFIARRFGAQSSLGSILDPVADKLFTASMLYLLTREGAVPIAYFLISTLRDFSQLMAIPILISWKTIAFKVKPKFPAKLATTLKFGSVFYGLFILILGMPELMEVGLFQAFMVFSIALEVYILIKYCFRLHEILHGRADTFE